MTLHVIVKADPAALALAGEFLAVAKAAAADLHVIAEAVKKLEEPPVTGLAAEPNPPTSH